MKQIYEIQPIILKSLKGKDSEHYNIINAETKEKVCTCYKIEKANFLIDILNS